MGGRHPVGVEYRTRKTRLQQRLDDIEARLRAAAGRDPLADIAGQPDADEIWQRLDLGRQRAILDALLVVTVLPKRRRRPPAEGHIDPRTRRHPATPHRLKAAC